MKTCVWVVVLDDDDNGGGGDWVEKHYQFNSQIHVNPSSDFDLTSLSAYIQMVSISWPLGLLENEYHFLLSP